MKDEIICNISKVKEIIEAMNSGIDWVSEDMISADDGLWQIFIAEHFPNQLILSFHVNACPCFAASITKRLSFLTSLVGIDVVISDVYALELDEEVKVKDICFGREAYEKVGREHYNGLVN